jgi:hypothetical protein
VVYVLFGVERVLELKIGTRAANLFRHSISKFKEVDKRGWRGVVSNKKVLGEGETALGNFVKV